MKELTHKHWRVYDLLRANADRYLEQKEIAKLLPELFPYDETIDFHSTIGRELCSIIQDLNDSDVIQKIILSSSKGNKISTEEEFDEWFNRNRIALLRRMKRLYYKKHKAGLNGQVRLQEFDDNSKAREWFETFIKEGV
jgi:hypothetical protein